MNDFGMELANRMLEKHNIFISAKWHRVNFTPGLIISKNEAERVMDTLISEFKQLADFWIK